MARYHAPDGRRLDGDRETLIYIGHRTRIAHPVFLGASTTQLCLLVGASESGVRPCLHTLCRSQMATRQPLLVEADKADPIGPFVEVTARRYGLPLGTATAAGRQRLDIGIPPSLPGPQPEVRITIAGAPRDIAATPDSAEGARFIWFKSLPTHTDSGKICDVFADVAARCTCLIVGSGLADPHLRDLVLSSFRAHAQAAGHPIRRAVALPEDPETVLISVPRMPGGPIRVAPVEPPSLPPEAVLAAQRREGC